MSETDTTSAGGPGDGELPLSFEAWAELSARLARLSPEQRVDILDEREVETEDWQRCEMHYMLSLADDAVQGRTDRATLYADACMAEMERHRAAASVVGPAADASDAHADPAPDPAPMQARAPETGVPSFLQRPASSPVAIGRAPSVQRAPEHLAGTAMAFELPTALRPKASDALPFQPGASPLIAGSAAEPKPSPAAAPTAGATLGVGVDLSAQAHATLPFAKSTREAPRVLYPRMPMQTYASFATELALFPEKTAEILQKYSVSSEAARAALEEEWRGRLEAHADVKAEWEAMVATYRDWLLKQR